MKIYLNIDYRTVFGEELVLNIISQDGQEQKSVKYRMTTLDGERWTYELRLSATQSQLSTLHYYYSVETEGKEKRHEWLTQPHCLELSTTPNPSSRGGDWQEEKVFVVYDRWIDIPEDAYLYSSAFTECVNRRGDGKEERGERRE
ncbi:MAG: hypothetical protein IJS97_08545, partial [Prevotella sp.]|nr:hypothetical protein [Prevotella sp.]